MVLIVGLLYCLLALKLVAIVNAIRWLDGHGSEYRKRIVLGRLPTSGSHEELLDKCAAGFFPFGLKEYRLARAIRRLPPGSIAGQCRRWALVIFKRIVFQFQGLAFISVLVSVITAKSPTRLTLAPRIIYGSMGTVLGLLLMVGVVLLAAEAFMSYAILGSYGTAFHHLDARRPGRGGIAARKRGPGWPGNEARNPIIAEMYAYAGLLITAYVITATTSYFVSVRLGGFDLLSQRTGSGTVAGGRLFDSFYWTLMLAVGSGGAGPRSVLAKTITMIGAITAILLLIIVLAGLAGITITALEPPQRPARRWHGRPTKPAVRPRRYQRPAARHSPR